MAEFDLRIGTGIDVHPFASTPRPLRLAGVEVHPHTGLAGHSDADVVAHALTDALLGAIGHGDLGARFGVDEPGTAGADSLGLLGEVVAELAAEGWQLGNADLTVLAQRPRLAGYRDAMRARLAAVLDAPTDRVSVKFTTTDELGAIGRAEGIACVATVLLRRDGPG